jgi:hypothetical protein
MRTLALCLSLLLALAAATSASAAPKPRLARTVVVAPAGGVVKVKQRGGRSFRLRKATAVKMGTRIDTTSGKVKLTSARSRTRTQSGKFSKGAFVVTQQRNGLTDLTLAGGDFSVCTAARKAGKPLRGAAGRQRRLFGSARGRFRTRGRNSSATVRGTEWLTEDRCEGTVIQNSSPDPSSKVETQTGDNLELELEPGYTATYYCNKFVIEPDTYCLVLLARPADGLIGAGIITQADVNDYALCVRQPSGTEGCYQFPMSGDDAESFRQSIVVCPVGAAGRYDVAWSIDYETFLYPNPLSLELDVAGPPIDCITDPPLPGQPQA